MASIGFFLQDLRDLDGVVNSHTLHEDVIHVLDYLVGDSRVLWLLLHIWSCVHWGLFILVL